MRTRRHLSKHDTLEIPRALIAEGLQRCHENARSLLIESHLLLQDGHTDHAAVLYSIALEEIGKAELLLRSEKEGSDPVVVPGWKNHDRKLSLAHAALGPSYFQLRVGVFDPRIFDNRMFDVGLMADFAVRAAGLYVDFVSGHWTDPPGVNKQRLEELTRGLLGVIDGRMKS